MTNTIIDTGDRRTARLTEAELVWLKKSAEKTTVTFLAKNLRIERSSLAYTIARGTAHPNTVKKIRRAFQKQLTTA